MTIGFFDSEMAAMVATMPGWADPMRPIYFWGFSLGGKIGFLGARQHDVVGEVHVHGARPSFGGQSQRPPDGHRGVVFRDLEGAFRDGTKQTILI